MHALLPCTQASAAGGICSKGSTDFSPQKMGRKSTSYGVKSTVVHIKIINFKSNRFTMYAYTKKSCCIPKYIWHFGFHFTPINLVKEKASKHISKVRILLCEVLIYLYFNKKWNQENRKHRAQRYKQIGWQAWTTTTLSSDSWKDKNHT